MGDIVDLQARRRERRKSPRRRVERIYVDVADRDALVVAERLERLRPDVRLRVAGAHLVEGGPDARIPVSFGHAQRAASYAVACGRGNRFVLAALRLAHAGGYDLRAPEVLVEAAAAAGLGLATTLAAAREERWNGAIMDTSAMLRLAGVTRLPALQTSSGRFLSGVAPITAYLAVSGSAHAGVS